MVRHKVKFTLIPMDESRIPPELKRQFLTIGRLVQWEYVDRSVSYAGLVVIGEQPIHRGFQTIARPCIETATTMPLPLSKLHDVTSVVMNEFMLQRIPRLFAAHLQP